MKIRTNLFLLSAIFVMLIAALGFIVLQSFSQINREIKESNSANKMIKDIFELNIVTYEYFMHHEKRMWQQWMLKYDSLGKLLERMRKEDSHPECQDILESITSDYKALGNLFLQLQANFSKRKRLIEENRPQVEINMTFALEERLIAQALMRAQKITSGAFRSSIITQQRIARVGQRTNWIVLFSIIGFAILSFCISFLTITAITRPLNKLVKSAEIIGEGNLDHRVDIKTKNEIGGLAVAFDQMTERRKLAEERLRQSEAKYLDLYSSAPVAYLSIGTDGLIETANKAAEDLTCYRSEELQGMKVFNLYPEESKEKAKELFEKFRRGIPFENEEIIYKRKDGHKIHCLLSVSPIKDENGLVLESRSVVVDITKRKRAEEELGKHREHLEELVRERTAELTKANQHLGQQIEKSGRAEEALRESENSLTAAQRVAHMGSWELDLVINELKWSDEIYRIFGLKPQEFGATYEAFLNAVHPDDREFVDTSYTKSVKSNTPYDIVHRIVRPDGEVRYVHEIAEDIKDETGKTIRSIGSVQDITERKQAEDALEKRTGELHTMVNAMAGREIRMAELKETIKKLRAQLEETGMTPVADDPLKEI